MVRLSRVEFLFLTGAVLGLGLLTFLIFRPFLDWVILGFLIAYLVHRPYRVLARWVRRPSIAGAAMLTLVLLLFFLPFVLVVAILIRDVGNFAQALAGLDVEGMIVGFLQSIAVALGADVEPESLEAAAATIATHARTQLATFLTGVAAGLPALVASVMLGLFIFAFTLYYGLVDGDRFVRGIEYLLPLHADEKRVLLSEVRSVTNAVFVGHLLIALIQALIGTLGFVILGVPNAFFWGFVMLLLAILPVLGPFLVWLPVGLYLLFLRDAPVDGWFSSNPTFAAVGVLAVVGPVVSTIDNILRPKLVGARADVHPFLVLIGALGGLLVFGFTGFVVGPLVLAMFVATLRVYRTHWTEGETSEPHLHVAKGRKPPRLVPRGKKTGA